MNAAIPVFQGAIGSFRSYYQLCKPRVVALIVFTAVIGMLLVPGGMPGSGLLLAASAGIALVAGAAAAVNCLIEQRIDALMARTRRRPLPMGQVTSAQTLVFSAFTAGTGLWLLYAFVNPLTMWLTLGTFLGYAVIYTAFLKPATPQNIVIGGAAGAMPPVLGWAAVTNTVTTEPLLLFLIVFCWTPPHFWSLAVYRVEDYARSGLPMLPVTHGREFTCLHILLYTVILASVTLLPFSSGMSGWPYLVAAVLLNARYLMYAVALWRDYSDALARKAFRFSIVYLAALFAALLVDHWLPF